MNYRLKLLMMWRAGVTPDFMLLFALGLLLASCDDGSSDVVKTRVEPNADFTAYRTFAFSSDAPNPDGGVAPIPSSAKAGLSAVNDAVRSELQGQGLVEVSTMLAPDLFVVSLSSTDDRQALTWACVPNSWWGYWWGYDAWAVDPCAWLEPLYINYEVGTAAVALVDVEADRVPFGGVMQGVLDSSGSPTARVEDDVHRMFEAYPAEQTGSAP
jgi:hypothetical protein